MSLGKNIRVFKLSTGEIIITEIKEVDDEGMYALDYPAMIIPIPPQQAGGQQGQVGFGKLMPFSDYKEEITLNPAFIVLDTTPAKQMLEAYGNWSNQVRGMDSGIVMPNMVPPAGDLKSGQADGPIRPDFSKGLNV
jgi:hypothetical protein